jgi:tetrahydromethanopterin S-methyltransferase subunit F/DNA-binding transcriptional ArsR family regulator
MHKFIKILSPLFSWGFFLLGLLMLMHSCIPVNKIGELADKLKMDADTMGQNLSRGLSTGIDTTRLNALAAGMVREAGQSLKKEMDSVSFQKLKDSLTLALTGVLAETEASLEEILNDPTRLDVLDAEVAELLQNAKLEVDRLTSDLVPQTLSDANQQIVLDFRDELLGPSLAKVLKETLDESLRGTLKNLVEGDELDSLISKVTLSVDSAKVKVDDTVFKIDKTVARIGGVAIGIVAALTVLFVVLWLRKSAQNKQQKELLVKLTKAIDAIPDQGTYDRTITHLHDQINQSHDPKQNELLDQILKEYQGQYPHKKKYKNYRHRLIEHLKNKARDQSLDPKLFEDIQDEEFKNYIRKELE